MSEVDVVETVEPTEAVEVVEANVQRRDTATTARIAARKMRDVENPASIVIDPRTREGHMMVKLMFLYDRAVSAIRMKAGLSITIDKVNESLLQANEFTQRLDALTGMFSEMSGINPYGTGTFQYETPEAKRLLAARPRSYVFIPQSEEGRKVALSIKRIFPLLIHIRTTSTDFARAGAAITSIIQSIVDFCNLSEQLLKTAKLDYEIPKGMGALVSAAAANI
ncbi:MAG: hypothetical protein WCJ37_01970 [Syntrophus sp. (in: bacteria)]